VNERILELYGSGKVAQQLELVNQQSFRLVSIAGRVNPQPLSVLDRVAFFDGTQYNRALPFVVIDTIPITNQSESPRIRVETPTRVSVRLPCRVAIWKLASYATLRFNIVLSGTGQVRYENLVLDYPDTTFSVNNSAGVLSQIQNAIFQASMSPGSAPFPFADALGVEHNATTAFYPLTFTFAPGVLDPIGHPLFQCFLPRLTRQFLLLRSNQSLKSFSIKIFGTDLSADKASQTIQSATLGHGDKVVDATGTVLAPTGIWLSDWVLPARAFWRTWRDEVFLPYHRSLQTVQDGNPVSFLPELINIEDVPAVVASSDLDWPGAHLRLRLRDGSPFSGSYSNPATFDFIPLKKFSTNGPTLQLIVSDSFFSPAVHPSLTFQYPGVRTHAAKAVNSTAAISPVIADEHAPHPIIKVQGALLNRPTSDSHSVRMGALDLAFVAAPVPPVPQTPGFEPQPFEMTASLRTEDLTPVGSESIVGIDANFVFALQQVTPGGQDPLPGEDVVPENYIRATETDDFEIAIERRFRREAPLLITHSLPQQVPAAVVATNLFLTVSERTEEGLSQTLRLRLNSNSPDASPTRVIVLDRQPLLLAEVLVPPFARQDPSTGASEFANWQNRGVESNNWNIAGSTAGFDLLLPPQTLGEEMEKHTTAGIEDAKPAKYRLSPQARITLLSSYLKQRYTEAPWNLRRILGYVGQRAPGAAVRFARFELLYGMTARVTYPDFRISELAARLGAMPGRQLRTLAWSGSTHDQRTAYSNRREDWSRTFAQMQSRLGLFEVYDERQSGGTHINRDVEYELRKSSRIWQLTDGQPQPIADVFHGGATWGVEFSNVLKAIWRDPKSTSGELANPYFSSYGGWGYQKAGFDEDRSKIISNTAMGRVHYYSLERIGRIKCYWNVAKHVIIYERTALPSAYFESEQNAHPRRVILRKVREYIEVLQPERRYPDYGATPVSRGFVLGCEFKSRIINVKSSWGTDVRDEGYQIPLWRVGEDKDLYPKPQIQLILAGVSAEDPVSVAIDDVQKLLFYSSTAQGTGSDPNLWAAVRDIDYADIPNPAPPKTAYLNNQRPDASLPAPRSTEPGFDAFTFAVNPSERLPNLVAERTTEAIGAIVRNVSMSRSSVIPAPPTNPIWQSINDGTSALRNTLQSGFDTLLSKLPASGSIDQTAHDWLMQSGQQLANTYLGTPIADAYKQINTVAAQFPTLNANSVLTQHLSATFELWRRQVARQTQQFRDELAKALDGTAWKQQAKLAIKNFCHVALEGARVPLENGLAGASAKAKAAVASVQSAIAQSQANIDVIRRQLQSANLQILADRERVRTQIETSARQIDAMLADTQQRITGQLGGPFEKVAATVRGSMEALRDSLRTKSLEAIHQVSLADASAVTQQLDQLAADVQALVTTVNNLPLINVLNQAAAQVDGYLPALQASIEGAQTGMIAAVDDAAATIDTVRDAVDAQLIAIDNAINIFLNDLQTATTTWIANNVSTLLTGPAQILNDQIAAWDQQFQQKWQQTIGAVNKQVDDIRKDLLKWQDEAINAAQEVIAGYEREAASLIPGGAAQAADNTLRLVRAFGDPPSLNDLVFNRDRVAYYFNELDKAVQTTPMAALVNRAGDELKSFGLRIPTNSLLDRCVPASLQDFDIGKILPDFGGIRFDNLFPGVHLPALANKNIKVTHGADPQSRRAWMEAVADVPMDQPATIFAFGPILLKLTGGRFQAQQRLDVREGEAPQSKTYGEVAGSWDLQIGGVPLVIFRQTRLIYDGGGGFRFDLSPDRVEVQGAMKFLGDAMRQLNTRGKGFIVRVREEGGLPCGVEARLDLPLPNVSFGAFALMNLRLGALMALNIPLANPGEFSIKVGFNIGTKLMPFRLTVLFLTGGGWLEANATYTPAKSKLEASVTIGIVAGAAIEFSFGPIQGGVMVVLGIYGEFSTPSNSLNLSVMLLAQGQVNVAGMISVFLSVLLEMTYESGTGTLIGRGSVSLSIKICWCFTLNVSTSVQYKFAGSNQASNPNNAVDDYLALMEG